MEGPADGHPTRRRGGDRYTPRHSRDRRAEPAGPAGDETVPGDRGVGANGDDDLPEGEPEAPGTQRTLRTVGEYAGLAVLAIVLSSLLKAFIGLAFYIPSGSMLPTLHINDRVVVSRLSYHLHDPNRGDVVVFQNPGYVAPPKPNLAVRAVREVLEVIGAQQPRDKNLIKRVIGLPGERFSVHDGSVYIDGKQLDEPWLPIGTVTDWEGSEGKELTVPAGHYIVLGDNRGDSCDSRCFPEGPFVERSAMVGRAFIRIWPFWRIAWL